VFFGGVRRTYTHEATKTIIESYTARSRCIYHAHYATYSMGVTRAKKRARRAVDSMYWELSRREGRGEREREKERENGETSKADAILGRRDAPNRLLFFVLSCASHSSLLVGVYLTQKIPAGRQFLSFVFRSCILTHCALSVQSNSITHRNTAFKFHETPSSLYFMS